MNIRITSIVAMIAFYLTSIFTQAAPIPGSSTSPLLRAGEELYRSEVGFSLHANGTDWKLVTPPASQKFVLAMYQAPVAKDSPTAAALTVRLDPLAEATKIESYVGKWLPQYSRYGFELIGHKKFKVKQHNGYVIDLKNDKAGKQMRQVVFLKDKAAVVMTCQDKLTAFSESLKACNAIIRSFDWQSAIN